VRLACVGAHTETGNDYPGSTWRARVRVALKEQVYQVLRVSRAEEDDHYALGDELVVPEKKVRDE
jgi:hypothetical protein